MLCLLNNNQLFVIPQKEPEYEEKNIFISFRRLKWIGLKQNARRQKKIHYKKIRLKQIKINAYLPSSLQSIYHFYNRPFRQ